MAWIEFHQTLRNEPKVYRLVELWGVSKADVIGTLALFWWWVLDYAVDGVLTVPPAQIAAGAEWKGDPKQFVATMIDAGWLKRSEGHLVVNAWDKYSIHYQGTLERRDRKTRQILERVQNWRSGVTAVSGDSTREKPLNLYDVTRGGALHAGLLPPPETLPPLPPTSFIDNEALSKVSAPAAESPESKPLILTHVTQCNAATNQPTYQPTNLPGLGETTADPNVPQNGTPKGVHGLIDIFFQMLEKKIGEPPGDFNGGAAAKGFKKLRKDFDDAEIAKRFAPWFASNQKFIVRRNWCVEEFFKHFNALKDGPIFEVMLPNVSKRRDDGRFAAVTTRTYSADD